MKELTDEAKEILFNLRDALITWRLHTQNTPKPKPPCSRTWRYKPNL
jgi:hypothetical protein